MAKATLVVAAIMAFMNFQIGSAAVVHSDCIIIMGGRPNDTVDKLPIEYYHPDVGAECNQSHILPNFMLTKDQTPRDTSGCYLTGPQMIVAREGSRHLRKSTVYSLRDGTTKQIPAAYSSGIVLADSSSVSTTDPSRCLSCGGYNKNSSSDHNIKQCYQFDILTNKWSSHSNLPITISAAAFVSLGGHFYLISGRTNTAGNSISYNQTANLYVLLNNAVSWKQKRSMTYSRTGHAAVPLSDDEFIVCGGSCGYGCQYSSCEIYNTKSDTWHEGGSMITGRCYFALVTFNEQIFAIGGEVGVSESPTETVEVYNKTSNIWSKAPKPLKFGRYSFVAFPITLPPKTTTTVTTRTVPTTTHKPLPATIHHKSASDTTKSTRSNDPMATTEKATATSSNISPIMITIICLGGIIVIIVPITVLLACLWCRRKRRSRSQEKSKRQESEMDSSMSDELTPKREFKYNKNQPRLKNYADGTETETTIEPSGYDEADTVPSHRIDASLTTDGEY